jgi:micrococcal nuclease
MTSFIDAIENAAYQKALKELKNNMEKYIYRGKLERVVDGDTIDALIDVGFDIWVKKRIRYKGIDTWESRTRNLEEKAKGLEAKARNKELLMEVSSKSGYFRLKSYGVGKYGRVLGEIFIEDKEGKQYNINKTLISEGHAYVYEGGKKKLFTS